MIGFNALGQLGRLGNQMFQFAALKGIARHRGFEYCFPPTQNKNEWMDHQLLNAFKFSYSFASFKLALKYFFYKKEFFLELY